MVIRNRGMKSASAAAVRRPSKGSKIVQDSRPIQRLLDIAARVDEEEGIRQGLDDMRKGKIRDTKEFFDEFEAQHGITR